MSDRIIWVAWRHDPAIGEFKLDTPWWYWAGPAARDVVAAVVAGGREEALEAVLSSYTGGRPEGLAVHFVGTATPVWTPAGWQAHADWAPRPGMGL